MSGQKSLKLLHMYPNVLDLYGDGGNVEVLKYRCKMRGIELIVTPHYLDTPDTADFSQQDIIYLGGGADYEQQLLAQDLLSCKDKIAAAHKNGVFMLMICGGYQLMGQYYKDSNGEKIRRSISAHSALSGYIIFFIFFISLKEETPPPDPL